MTDEKWELMVEQIRRKFKVTEHAVGEPDPRDKAGRWWHTSTIVIGVKNNFERRIGIWPAGFDDDGVLHCDTAYGDYLEELTPGTRERTAELGAAGFEDVVAAITPIAGEDADTPAHWSVTFAVEDADATAARAAELGGKVDVPPFDAPWVRMTVITDPQGATFIASKFVPENRDLAGQAGPAAAAA